MKYEVIDVHSHIFPDNIAERVIDYLEGYYHFKWGGTGTVDDLLKSMDSGGVGRSVVFSSATKSSQVEAINTFIGSVCAKYSRRFIGFGTVHPDYPDFGREFERMKGLGLCGIKIHPDFQQFNIDAPEMLRIYDVIGDSMPILFHVGDRNTDFSSPRRLAHVLDEMPYLRVVGAHLGGYSVWEEAWKYLIGRDLRLDISSVFPHISYEEGRRMVLAHGLERVLFASDYPAVRHDRAVEDVLAMGLSEVENEMIFHKNAERMLGGE